VEFASSSLDFAFTASKVSQKGAVTTHLLRFRKYKANHNGTLTGLPGLKGPKVPYKICFS